MSDKKILITTCNDCPNTYEGINDHFRCCELGREIDLDTIPKDCPLEDY